MIPREKAAQLVVDYQLKVKSLDYNEAVQCALVTVDEMIIEKQDCSRYECHGNDMEYWQQVKQEIEKL